MPTSRKRKGARKYRPKRAPREEVSSAPTEPSPPARRAHSWRPLLTFFPFISGTVICSITLQDPGRFLALYAAVALLHYFVFEKVRRSLGAASPTSILIAEALSLIEMMLYAVFGGYAQLGEVHLRLAIFGYVPACFVAAAGVARHADVFENAGWVRQRLVTQKTGESVKRPGNLTQLFTMLFVFGPLVPIVLAPLQLLPTTFLLAAAPLYFLPMIGSAFFERLAPEDELAARCMKLAVLALAMTLFGGLLAVY